MGETRNILQSPSSGLSNFRPEFFKSEFDKAIQAKGYDVEIMRALRCPVSWEKNLHYQIVRTVLARDIST